MINVCQLPAILCYVRESTQDLLKDIEIPPHGDTAILRSNESMSP
jgi:hypothetical protein